MAHPENFALAVFGLSIVTSISSDNLIKGLLSMMMGLMISNVGMDILTAESRFTFGWTYLLGGLAYIVILIALYAFSQGLINVEGYQPGKVLNRQSAKLTRVLPTWKAYQMLYKHHSGQLRDRYADWRDPRHRRRYRLLDGLFPGEKGLQERQGFW